ncbi:MAG TPA: hypothetical protein VNU20_05790 [Candidatus Sulfotelmatobacter sp.]|jgi:hypothetical protein|nr:hypothetical protein [Candidatus Sulfotelmatobacter sp.]
MDEMKPKENAYSGERAPVAPVTAPAETSAQAFPAETAGTSHEGAQALGIAGMLEVATSNLPASLAATAAFLKRTKRVWLMAAGIVIGVAALVNLSARAAEWAKNTRERRQLHAMATLTPERLYARCGAAVVDETKVIYPVLMRTISYHPRGGEKLVISFSRTAEEKSDWVFLSMQNEDGAASYDTPEAKIAALPCLDSNK